MVEKKRAEVPTFSFDVDDVSIDFVKEGLAPYHNKNYPPPVLYEQYTSYVFREHWRCSAEEESRRIFEFYATPQCRRIPPVSGAAELFDRVSEKGKILGLTSRPKFIADLTCEALEEYFPGCFTDYEFLGSYADAHKPADQRTPKKSKGQVCVELGAISHTDDHYLHALSVAQHGILSLLFRAPWNRGYSDEQLMNDRIIPVVDCEQVWEVVKKIAEGERNFPNLCTTRFALLKSW